MRTELLALAKGMGPGLPMRSNAMLVSVSVLELVLRLVLLLVLQLGIYEVRVRDV